MKDPGQSLHRASPSGDDDEISVLAFIRFLLEYRYLILGTALLAGLLMAGSALMGPRTYTAEASFMPQGGASGGSAGTLGALAGQFGVNVPQGNATESPAFYVELLGSRALLSRLLNDTYVVTGDSTAGPGSIRGTLAEFFGIESNHALIRRDRTLRALSGALSASTTTTGIVRVEVTTRWAELSAGLAQRLIQLVNDFNLENRQANAAAESRFVESRLSETAADLREAENDLRTFLESNRQFRNSPELLFEHDRLQRRVMHQQQLYTGLQQSLEGARLARVRNTPLITVLEPAERPVYPDSRQVPLRGILGLILGSIAGVFLALVRNVFAKGSAQDDPDYQQLRQVWRDTLADFRIGRRRTSTPGERDGGR